MASCDLCDRCFFFNERLFDNLLRNAECLRGKYCAGDFTECTIYKLAKHYGIGKVRGFVYPDEIIENLNTHLPLESQPHGGAEMLMKVVFADGYLGEVWASRLGRFIRKGKIAAYLSVEEWVEVRRKRINIKYSGPERRRTNLGTFTSC